jgi:hypothetical protein
MSCSQYALPPQSRHVGSPPRLGARGQRKRSRSAGSSSGTYDDLTPRRFALTEAAIGLGDVKRMGVMKPAEFSAIEV